MYRCSTYYLPAVCPPSVQPPYCYFVAVNVRLTGLGLQGGGELQLERPRRMGACKRGRHRSELAGLCHIPLLLNRHGHHCGAGGPGRRVCPARPLRLGARSLSHSHIAPFAVARTLKHAKGSSQEGRLRLDAG